MVIGVSSDLTNHTTYTFYWQNYGKAKLKKWNSESTDFHISIDL